MISLNRMRMLTGGAKLSDSLSSASNSSLSSGLDTSNHSANPLSPDASRHDPSPTESATEFLAHQRDLSTPAPLSETSESQLPTSDVYLPLSPFSSAAPSSESSSSAGNYPPPDISTHGAAPSRAPSQPHPGSYGHWDLPEDAESTAAASPSLESGNVGQVERDSSAHKFHTPSPSIDDVAVPFNRLLLTQCSLRKSSMDGGASKSDRAIGQRAEVGSVEVFLTPSPSIDQEHRASISRPLPASSDKQPMSSPSASDQTLLLSVSSDRLALASPSSSSSSLSSSKPSDPALSGSPDGRSGCGECEAKMVVDGLKMMRLLDMGKGCSKHRLGGVPAKEVGGSQEAP